jgi:hypothetical protein
MGCVEIASRLGWFRGISGLDVDNGAEWIPTRSFGFNSIATELRAGYILRWCFGRCCCCCLVVFFRRADYLGVKEGARCGEKLERGRLGFFYNQKDRTKVKAPRRNALSGLFP